MKPTPWHEVVKLRDDLKTGELSLSLFAADLYDVAMDKARPVYQGVRFIFLRRSLAREGGRVEPKVIHWARGSSCASSQEERRSGCSPKTYKSGGKNWENKSRAGVAQWRATHPQATLAQIEQAVDEQIHRLRARMIEQAAQASAAAGSEASQGLVCEQCAAALQARGRAKRHWQTQGGQQVEVERTYVSCPQCGGGFFPPG